MRGSGVPGWLPQSAWFLARDGRQHGPVSSPELEALVERNMLSPADLVWREGLPGWLTVGQIVAQHRPQPSQPQPPAPSPRIETPFPSASPPRPRAPAPISQPVQLAPVDPEGAIFLSYRRDDSAPWAGRVYDGLVHSYGRSRVFMDVDNIAPGHDFVAVLDEKVASADLFLCVIGPRWADARNARGDRRLDDPNDFVRIEVESALRRGKLVVPILVDGARMPSPDELPDSLTPLSRRNAVEITHARFGRDVASLIEALPLRCEGVKPKSDPAPATPTPTVRTESAPALAFAEPMAETKPAAARPRQKSRAGRVIAAFLMLCLLLGGGVALKQYELSQRREALQVESLQLERLRAEQEARQARERQAAAEQEARRVAELKAVQAKREQEERAKAEAEKQRIAKQQAEAARQDDMRRQLQQLINKYVYTRNSGSSGRPSPGSRAEFSSMIGDKVYFTQGSADLTPDALQTLKEQARWLNKHRTVTISLGGHTDERQDFFAAIELSGKRAHAVRQYLVDAGIDASRIGLVTFGREWPFAFCHDISCWAQNNVVHAMIIDQ